MEEIITSGINVGITEVTIYPSAKQITKEFIEKYREVFESLAKQ